MSKNPLSAQLQEVVSSCILKYSGDIEVSPASIATCAYPELDPENVSPVTVQWGCVLQLRAIAREVLRGEFDPIAEGNSGQGEMFEGLQERYPTKREGGPKYVLLGHLTGNEIDYNIQRLEREATKKLHHADALKEYKIFNNVV